MTSNEKIIGINANLILEGEEVANSELTEVTEDNLKDLADQLQFDTLAQECIVEDLCKSYNITRDDLFILIHELKKRGNNIVTMNTTATLIGSEEEKKTVTLIRNFGHEHLINDLSYEIVDNDDEIKCMLISDLRFGSIYQQTSILNDMYVNLKGEIEMLEFEEKRFTPKDCKKDDYLKAKQLVLKKK